MVEKNNVLKKLLIIFFVFFISFMPSIDGNAASKAALNKKSVTLKYNSTKQLKVKKYKGKVKWKSADKIRASSSISP